MSENIDTGKRDKKNMIVDIHSAFDVLYEAFALIFVFSKIDLFTYIHYLTTHPMGLFRANGNK